MIKGRREKWVVVTVAALFGVAFGILNLACEQREDQPEVRTDAPASAKVRPDTPPAPAAPKVTETRKTRVSTTSNSHLQDLGNQLEGLRANAKGELGLALANLEVEQSNGWPSSTQSVGKRELDAARAELVRKIIDLRERIHEFKEKVNA